MGSNKSSLEPISLFVELDRGHFNQNQKKKTDAGRLEQQQTAKLD